MNIEFPDFIKLPPATRIGYTWYPIAMEKLQHAISAIEIYASDSTSLNHQCLISRLNLFRDYLNSNKYNYPNSQQDLVDRMLAVGQQIEATMNLIRSAAPLKRKAQP